MTNWIEWNGGACPIKSDKTRVEYKCRDGYTDNRHGFNCRWDHESYSHSNGDIIAYRIIEDHEPKKSKEPKMTREQLTEQIAALQKQLNAMPEKQRIWVTNSRIWPLSGPSTATHYFDIETINGVPHIHGIAMKAL